MNVLGPSQPQDTPFTKELGIGKVSARWDEAVCSRLSSGEFSVSFGDDNHLPPLTVTFISSVSYVVGLRDMETPWTILLTHWRVHDKCRQKLGLEKISWWSGATAHSQRCCLEASKISPSWDSSTFPPLVTRHPRTRISIPISYLIYIVSKGIKTKVLN